MAIRFAATIAALLVASWSPAQDRAPRGKATATIAGKHVEIDYGRPRLKGRSIPELLQKLPEDRIWRAGENQVTTLTTQADLMIGGTRVPAGKYSLYVHAPAEGEWSLILNTNLGVPLGQIFAQAPPELKDAPWPYLQGYTEKIGDKEVVRAKMTKIEVSEPVETFTIELEPSDGGATLKMMWGEQGWAIAIEPAKSS